MGKGKGEPEYWAAVVQAGQILFEIGGLPEAAARDCLARVAYKMPFKCRFVHPPAERVSRTADPVRDRGRPCRDRVMDMPS